MPEITSFLGCFFTLKIQKKVLRQSQKCKNPLGTTRQTPCGVENHICDHFLGHFAQNNLMLHLCYTCPKMGYFGTSGTKVGHGVILGKMAQKVIANMILHPAGGLASSSEGVFTLL